MASWLSFSLLCDDSPNVSRYTTVMHVSTTALEWAGPSEDWRPPDGRFMAGGKDTHEDDGRVVLER